ncbi:putative nucleotidyltransferase, Ribonuclease H [Helianthus annuus]|nr:putative nucleotidyltransferase, Ribonuclease H [Helianthus annuus]
MNIKNLQVYVDSLLITNHFNGSYAVKSEKLMEYLGILKKLAGYFDVFTLEQVPREDNAEADALANLGSSIRIPEGIPIPILHILYPATDPQHKEVASIQDPEVVYPGEDPKSWTTPIMRYLKEGYIPEDENPKAFRMKVSRFTIINNILYKKSLAGPYLRCLEDPEAKEVLQDIHEGDCGNHTGGRSLFSKVLRTGYYWPTMRKDAAEYARRCDACQRHSNILHQPAEPLYPVASPWPFMKWGMDIVGKLPKAPGGKVFMLAMTDYFSKWVEAEAFVQVRDQEVVSFVKRNILTRFGVPAEIICDNGSQFISRRTTDFCKNWGIKMITSTPVHPQANGQAESSNKIIVNNLKKRLRAKKGRWAEELPFVLWADRTTVKNATGQTPFSLVFGAEAVIPTEMAIPTPYQNIFQDIYRDMFVIYSQRCSNKKNFTNKIYISTTTIIKPKKGYIINIAKDYALSFVSNRDPSTKSIVGFLTYLLNK